MSRHTINLEWTLDTGDFLARRYSQGKAWISTVTLEPHVTYRETTLPSAETEDALHHAAHEACFIANSVQTVITVQNRSPSLEGE